MTLENKKTRQEQYRLPHATVAIDCTHVQIKKPYLHGYEYGNRKGDASINVQATCNSKE